MKCLDLWDRGARLMHCAMAAIISLALTATLHAADSPRDRAVELVEEALHSKLYGQSERCQQLLQRAAEVDPSYAPAYWHRGLLQSEGRWAPAEQAIVDDARLPTLAEYRRVRGTFRNTLVSQMQAADWCRNRNLLDQERAHLTNALEIKPDHEPALLRLGYQPVPGGWVSSEEVTAAQQNALREAEAMGTWRPRVERWRIELMSPYRARRETAEQELLAIDDADAIGALEQVLSVDSQWKAQLVLKVLHNMTDTRAVMSLARHAVYSEWHSVREAAAKHLGDRQWEAYVPAMLATMQTRIDARVAAVRGRRGTQQTMMLVRERQNAFDRVRLDNVRPNADAQLAVHLENVQTQLTNQRIARALSVATGEELPADPHECWDWWDEQNEVFVEGEKPVRDYSRQTELARIDRIRDYYRGQEQSDLERWIESQNEPHPMPQRKKDCLAAGTSVWTASGQTPIERVQVGDMVLSQNAQTGELAYKVVLRTTVRPEEPLVRILTASDEFRTSGGHPFWVVGEGWVKARELKSGMTLQTLRGTLQISSVDSADAEPTYNLIVEEFNTYFVGETKTLTHDNTPRSATAAIVPGLDWE